MDRESRSRKIEDGRKGRTAGPVARHHGNAATVCPQPRASGDGAGLASAGAKIRRSQALGPAQAGALSNAYRRGKLPAALLLQACGFRPETTLIQLWRGRRHTVIALPYGFRYQGKFYRSLTAIAREITGTHRNGAAFFGLRDAKGSTDGREQLRVRPRCSCRYFFLNLTQQNRSPPGPKFETPCFRKRYSQKATQSTLPKRSG
jgi:hypothetical protein